mmetsp:Transcript_93063/g.150263  ORF Transcript_93063/g.150263 Transcript_93063/m.150263 type:complete len:111 (-) Transcript_93063:141-473(-)|eukprot:CAMPEP_0179431202 /NCGR_PEP_ID=MMETSP0799-20121207/16150_1 /TAXON_ID=46947 /ORGANISM="Geminigera cryophila, Strain CCMP2564" /LENGTH=110 /DNA_ID=CAMNT_0021208013 /DNA_START=238 /DNA_END=570 /DNA_ORIENTATION=+
MGMHSEVAWVPGSPGACSRARLVSSSQTSLSLSLALAEEKQQLEMLLRDVKRISSLHPKTSRDTSLLPLDGSIPQWAVDTDDAVPEIEQEEEDCFTRDADDTVHEIEQED